MALKKVMKSMAYGTLRLQDLTDGEQEALRAKSRRHQSSGKALRSRMITAFSKALDVLEDDGRPLEVLVADAIAAKPIEGLALAAKFVPKETEVKVQSTVELHLKAIREVVAENIAAPIRELSAAELLSDPGGEGEAVATASGETAASDPGEAGGEGAAGGEFPS